MDSHQKIDDIGYDELSCKYLMTLKLITGLGGIMDSDIPQKPSKA